MDRLDQPKGKRSGTALLAQNVHGILRNRIISLDLKQGMRLIEDDISKEIGVGRTPVREALLRLEGEGLVTRQRRGWIIQAVDPANARLIFEARSSVESYATRLAAQRPDAKLLKRLHELVDRMDEHETITRAELNRLDRVFHETIVLMAANPLFVEMHEHTQFRYWNLRLPLFFTKEQTQESNRQHRQILQAIENREPDTAEKHARDHIETTRQIVTMVLDGF